MISNWILLKKFSGAVRAIRENGAFGLGKLKTSNAKNANYLKR